MKYQWGSHNGETYKPKPNRKRQGLLLGSSLSLMIADVILPLTFGMGFVYARKLIKAKMTYVYGGNWK